ncbi:hypothetical protein C2G38_2203475 [Gigaspora rosea]|uniref:Uncharacterized protein n=1 Tax=Gigaspora rosea TaxID=44941 RepID=A0A397URL1_9GLOM|nr:hypothetical protein C2G38_2203475 [Gigaspora rosea]
MTASVEPSGGYLNRKPKVAGEASCTLVNVQMLDVPPYRATNILDSTGVNNCFQLGVSQLMIWYPISNKIIDESTSKYVIDPTFLT